MDPTLAAIVTVLAVLAASGVVAHARHTLAKHAERHRAMALERGLSISDVKQLERLSRYVSNTTLADLLISPVRYSRCSSRYLARLRRRESSENRYYAVVIELTRLRRKIHPPGDSTRCLSSTRELPEGEELLVSPGEDGTARKGVTWAVNEDHFEVRLVESVSTRGFRTGARVTIEINRELQGRYELTATIRKIEQRPRPVLRLEHADHVMVSNRREHLREPLQRPVTITLETGRTEVEAQLRDLSGGGLSFVLSHPLAVGSVASVALVLDPDHPPVRRRVEVLRREDLAGRGWRHVGEWVDVSEDERDAIIEHVFAVHRARIRLAKNS